MTPLLSVRGVTKAFGGVAANVDISFDVAPGEILGLIGPNGAGKTSLFNVISGEISPDRGEVLLDGQAISGRGPVACARAGVARTFQVVRSFDGMTVLENVMVGAFARGARPREAMQAAQDVLDFAGLGPRADALAHRLTPPEKRRLEIARALATRPRLLLLDEMLTGLPPTAAAGGVARVRALRGQGVPRGVCVQGVALAHPRSLYISQTVHIYNLAVLIARFSVVYYIPYENKKEVLR